MAALDELADFARAHQTPWPRDPVADPGAWGIHHVDSPPWNRLFGPVHPRGPCSGVAYDRGLLPDPDEPVIARVQAIGFESQRNQQVTWTQLLQQTSEWEGTCFGIPETVDRYRAVEWQPDKPAGRKGDPRPLSMPGTCWEYNDVRISQLSLALLHLFGQPLPEVFGEAIMSPVGAGTNWQWVGYDNSWVELPQAAGGTRRVQSVPGGSHWGGGLSIGARDQAGSVSCCSGAARSTGSACCRRNGSTGCSRRARSRLSMAI